MSKSNLLAIIKLAFGFVLAIGLLYLVRFFAPEPSSLHVTFTLGFLLLVGFIAGKTFSLFSLPELSGFLFVGMLCGSSGLSILGPQEILSIGPLNQLALVLIAVQAGSELSLKFLREGTRSISYVIWVQVVFIILGMTGVFLACIYFFGLSISNSHQVCFVSALIFATLSISKAPADTLAILGETKLKGKFANHILGVVVLIDILVIVLFQIVLLISKPIIVEGAYFDSSKILILLEELIASVAAGFSFGLIFILWFSIRKISKRENILFLILASFGISAMCAYLRYDTLIVFLVGGFIVSNLSRNGHSLIESVEAISHGVMIVFFASAGALLDLEVLKILWPYALVLSLARIFFTGTGTFLGHYLAGDSLERYKYSFSAYISQAGVTLVLAQNAARALGVVGERLAALATAVVALNEIIGPILFKLAIKREQKLFK